MKGKLLEQPQPLKLNENPPELPEGYKVGASTQNWEEHLQ
jgi:hypothetical protein